MKRYDPKVIESKWQKYWAEHGTYKVDLKSSKPKYYAMSMLNYPSGAGIHIGHAMNYTISDVMARFKRQQGYESYHPVGWDAFGLPAENYAIKTGVSPQASLKEIIPTYHKQYQAMGWSNDWSKEISTHEPEYYKWTQWIFAELYRTGLVYQSSRMQWWCSVDNTVLADEQVTADGKCWRHDGPGDPLVEKKEIKQWFFKITDYAEELLDAIDELDWTESVKLAQKNWIGKSQGAEIEFDVEDSKEKITVFTTRPDTIFGATYLVLAPEHPLASKLTVASHQSTVKQYIEAAKHKSDLARQESKDKTGVFSGAYAVNPANKSKIPIWIADYVLMGYGTGAIMGVPAHDERDYEFASKYNLPIVNVIEPTFGESHPDELHKVGVNVILRNPKDGKIIILDWGPRQKDHGGKMLIGGGVEEGEDIAKCAAREITEETGYKNVKLVAQSEAIGRGHFYSNVKDKYFSIDAHGLLFDLVNDEKIDLNLDEGEKDKFIVRWEAAEVGVAQLDDGIHKYFGETLALGKLYEGEGVLANSGKYDGVSTAEAREQIVKDLSGAKFKTNFRLQDWSVSRQRYWGAPIPIIHCAKCGPQLVQDKDLPVVLPEMKDFEPSGDGRSALARATDWLKVECPKCGGQAERETDTMDTYVDSAWYFLRYLDPHDDEQAFDEKIINKWMPVSFYNGADHATAHMLYARFITRFFHKQGLINDPEPFKKFLFNGKVTATDGSQFSKSKGGGPDPLDIIDSGYGADALRLYLMFAAPLEDWVRWNPQGVPGTYRFLNRIWTLVQDFLNDAQSSRPKAKSNNKQLLGVTHRTIKKVTDDLENQKYNTAIAAMMSLLNDFYKHKEYLEQSPDWRFAIESLVMMIGPFAPHVAEELWHQLGHDDVIQVGHWPQWDEKLAVSETLTIAVQVNGKVRGTIEIPADISEKEAIELAKAEPKVAELLKDQKLKQAIYVPGRIVSLVL